MSIKRLIRKFVFKLMQDSTEVNKFYFDQLIDKVENTNKQIDGQIEVISAESEYVREIKENVSDIQCKLEKMNSLINKYEILPGCEYAHYAIPLDYFPSREMRPRWGGIVSNPIPELYDFFAKYDDNYRGMLEYMRELNLESIDIRKTDKRMHTPAWIGGPITAIDALTLYAMIRKYKPKHYVEIGSGMTTLFARQAVKDGNLSTSIISIDPQPRIDIEAACDVVFRDGLEIMDLSKLDILEEGDILFLDGSHRTFMNSDVTVFFIDILPKLKKGVIIHLHDIHLPWDYPKEFINWYWNEQYMLAVCFLNGMDNIEILMPTKYITHEKKFDTYFRTPFVDIGEKNCEWQDGGSMWFRYK